MTKRRKTPMKDDARKARNKRKRETKAERIRARATAGWKRRERLAKFKAPTPFEQPEFKATTSDANADAAVKTLLADSFAAHTRALTLRQRGDLPAGDTQLTIARDKRLEAHALDPKHTAPAWTPDADHWRVYAASDVHAELLAFYERRLNPPKETE